MEKLKNEEKIHELEIEIKQLNSKNDSKFQNMETSYKQKIKELKDIHKEKTTEILENNDKVSFKKIFKFGF